MNRRLQKPLKLTKTLQRHTLHQYYQMADSAQLDFNLPKPVRLPASPRSRSIRNKSPSLPNIPDSRTGGLNDLGFKAISSARTSQQGLGASSYAGNSSGSVKSSLPKRQPFLMRKKSDENTSKSARKGMKSHSLRKTEYVRGKASRQNTNSTSAQSVKCNLASEIFGEEARLGDDANREDGQTAVTIDSRAVYDEINRLRTENQYVWLKYKKTKKDYEDLQHKYVQMEERHVEECKAYRHSIEKLRDRLKAVDKPVNPQACNQRKVHIGHLFTHPRYDRSKNKVTNSIPEIGVELETSELGSNVFEKVQTTIILDVENHSDLGLESVITPSSNSSCEA